MRIRAWGSIGDGSLYLGNVSDGAFIVARSRDVFQLLIHLGMPSWRRAPNPHTSFCQSLQRVFGPLKTYRNLEHLHRNCKHHKADHPKSLEIVPPFHNPAFDNNLQSKLEWFWVNTSTSDRPQQRTRRRMSQPSSTPAPTLSPKFCFNERVLRGSLIFHFGIVRPNSH